MMSYEKDEIIRYLIDNTPMIFDVEKEDLKYDTRHINYKIYKFIKELQEEIKELKIKESGTNEKSIINRQAWTSKKRV